MAIDDNTSYELTGAQVKDLANKIKAKADDNVFIGATSAAPGSKGIVPAPQAGDDTKFLSGDGTWKTAGGSGATTFYSVRTSGVTRFYSDQAATQLVTGQNIADAFASGPVYFSIGSGDLLSVISCLPQNNPGEYFFAVTNSNLMISYSATSTTEFIEDVYTIQEKLTAGSNISISGATISATDTTYSDFTGASSSTAGSAGLVPAPAAGDDTKFLSGDGTWKTAGGGGGGKTTLYLRSGTSSQTGFYTESSYTNKLTGQQVLDYLNAGPVEVVGPTVLTRITYYNNVYYTRPTLGASFRVILSGDDGDTVASFTSLSSSNVTLTYSEYKAEYQSESYSTTEVNTQTTWIDGSIIYKKTIDFGTLPNSSAKTVAHNISNIANIVKAEGWAKATTGVMAVLPFVSTVGLANGIQVTYDATNITVTTGTDRTNFTTCYFTLYYTKSS